MLVFPTVCTKNIFNSAVHNFTPQTFTFHSGCFVWLLQLFSHHIFFLSVYSEYLGWPIAVNLSTRHSNDWTMKIFISNFSSIEKAKYKCILYIYVWNKETIYAHWHTWEMFSFIKGISLHFPGYIIYYFIA